MSCSCGSNCSCGNNCSCGSKMYPSLGYLEKASTKTLVLGIATVKMGFENEGSEMNTKENGGCKCGSSCSCDPCNC